MIYSLQIIGDFPGFKIDINDDKLRTVLKIVTSLSLPPPALKNTTTYYNELPVNEGEEEGGRGSGEGEGGERGRERGWKQRMNPISPSSLLPVSPVGR